MDYQNPLNDLLLEQLMKTATPMPAMSPIAQGAPAGYPLSWPSMGGVADNYGQIPGPSAQYGGPSGMGAGMSLNAQGGAPQSFQLPGGQGEGGKTFGLPGGGSYRLPASVMNDPFAGGSMIPGRQWGMQELINAGLQEPGYTHDNLGDKSNQTAEDRGF